MDTLLITPELCRERSACEPGIRFMERFYKDGFTVDDVFTGRARHIPIGFSMWAYHTLPFTEEDKEKFREFYQIKDCMGFYQSHHISNCTKISHSSFCENSNNIESSVDIYDSLNVTSSNTVTKSSDIYDCERVVNCACVWNSKDVSDSIAVYKSTRVAKSFGVFDSMDVKDCYFVEHCVSADHLFFARNTSQSNRIACTEELDYDYAIFNHQVSEDEFCRTFDALMELFLKETEKVLIAKLGNLSIAPLLINDIYPEELFWYSVFNILRPTQEERYLLYNFTSSPAVLKI